MPTLDGSSDTPINSDPDSSADSNEATSGPTEGGSTRLPEESPFVATDQVAEKELESWDPEAHVLEQTVGGNGAAVPSGAQATGGSGGAGSRYVGEDPDSEPDEPGKMTFLDHLEELRSRIIYSVIAVVVGFLVSWSFRDAIYAALAWPITSTMQQLGMPDRLVYTNPTGVFSLYVQLAFVMGLFLASPFLLYQVWGFISPGLYPKERHYAIPFIFLCTGLFVSGAAFAYYVAFPSTLHFLLDFSKQFEAMITVNEYFSLAIMIILGLAIVFELPVLILFLTLLRVVTPGFLLRNFRYALLLIFLISALITPTPDVPTMMLFAAPLTGLYFMGVAMSYIVVRLRRQREEMS